MLYKKKYCYTGSADTEISIQNVFMYLLMLTYEYLNKIIFLGSTDALLCFTYYIYPNRERELSTIE